MIEELPIFYAIAATLGAVFVGAVGSGLWEWMKDNLSLPAALSRFPDIKGQWNIKISYARAAGTLETYTERLVIDQQFGRRFSGTIHTPHPTMPAQFIERRLRGEFKDPYRVVYWYESKSKRLPDIGAGLLQLRADRDRADGGAINFGVSSTAAPSVAKFVMERG